MIKKLIKSLFGLFMVGFGIVNFSYGILNIPDCFHYNVYGTEEYRPCQELDVDEDYTLGNSVFHLSDFFDFDNLDGYKYIGGNFHTTSYYYMFWSGSELINISSSTWNGRKYIGSPKFCYYSGTDYFGLFQKCGQHGIGTKGLYYDNYIYSFDNIYDIFNGINVSRYYINNMNYPNAGGSSYSPVSVCGVYEDIGQSFCIPFLDVSDFSYDGWYIEQHYEYINYTDGGSSASDVLGYIDYMTNSPLMSSGGGGGDDLNGSSGVVINNNITGDYIYSNCTYQQIFDYAESQGFNINLCYGGLDNFTSYDSSLTYNPIPGTGKTLGQILAYSQAWDTPLEWFNFWNGLYIDRFNNTYNAMWESYPAVYRTRFDLYYMYGGQNLVFDSVREYCAMKMLDIDFVNTYYKGQYFKNTCDYIKNNGDYPYDDVGTGNINLSGDLDNIIGVNWNGVGNFGTGNSGATVSNNPVVFIQNFFNQLKSNFPTRYDLGGGFLPLYIITFMCAIILFRFLSH